MAAIWTIRLLGGLSARQNEHVVDRFRTHKTGALLAYLAFHRGSPTPREQIMEVLWPESDLTAARNSLSVALSSLRAQLEPPQQNTPGASPIGGVVQADRNTVSLHPDAFTTDVAQFEAAFHHARSKAQSAPDAAHNLREAVAHYHGELLPGFFDDWIFPHRERLAGLYHQALCLLAARLLETGQFGDALETAHRAVAHDPMGEEATILLMRAYAHLNQPAQVRSHMATLEKRRKNAGDAPPRPETYWLAQRLAENTDPDKIVSVVGSAAAPASAASASVAEQVPSASPALADEPTPPFDAANNLPVSLTRFFGQNDALHDLQALLLQNATRLVTLSGPGGGGKTRLALEAARCVCDAAQWDGGVWFVPLADITEPAQIFQAVCDALRLPRRNAAAEATNDAALKQIVEHIGERSTLLVLDNMEHLQKSGPLDESGAAHQIRRLLTRLPHVRLLVTSRHVLGLEHETDYPVPLLDIPPAPADGDAPPLSPDALLHFPSVQLFVDRARNRRVSFQVTPRNADAVARLMVRLEGIPLAIELCAAWSRLLSPAQMEERMAERFALLVSQGRTAVHIPARQRTLWNTLQWGYDLLPPDAQRVFAALSVFRGDFGVPAAQAVCASGDNLSNARVVECVTLLQSASLLITAEGTEEIRLRLLETVRQFADAQLSDEERAQREHQHAEYFLEFASEAYEHRRDALQKRWFDRLETDMPNFRAALGRFSATETGLRMANLLGYFWKIRGYYREGRQWFEQVFSSPAARAADEQIQALQNDAMQNGTMQSGVRPRRDLPDYLYSDAWIGAGHLAFDMGDYSAAFFLFQKSVALLRALGGSENRLASALTNQGNISFRQGDYLVARALYEEASEVSQRIGDKQGVMFTWGSLGNVAYLLGDYTEARHLWEESLRLSRETGDDRMSANTLHNLGNLAQSEGDFARARVLYEESLVLERALGDRRGVAAQQTRLGLLAMQSGQTEAAHVLLADALCVLTELQSQFDMTTALEGLAWCATLQGHTLHAARLWSATQAARARLSTPYEAEERTTYEPLIEHLRFSSVSSAAFEAAWNEGSRLSLVEAAQSVLFHGSLPKK